MVLTPYLLSGRMALTPYLLSGRMALTPHLLAGMCTNNPDPSGVGFNVADADPSVSFSAQLKVST